VIAVDTNLLVYAHRAESEWHAPALSSLVALAEGRSQWAIPWPCLHEFLAIVTHPRIYAPPSPRETALASLAAWLGCQGCVPIGEGPGYFRALARLVSKGRVVGGLIHDARVAAICLHNGISVLWTADRDFSRFPELKTLNPLIPGKE
jgi:toxin-antitoxin system PIN domain toxin